MSINLDNVAGLTPEQIAAIKAANKTDKEAAIQKRLKQTEDEAEISTKLERLATLEDAETKRVEAAAAVKAQTDADKIATDGGVKDLDALKELKAYDKFVKETDKEKRAEMLADLKKNKPQLFDAKATSNEGKNLLGLTNVDLNNKQDIPKVY